VNTQSGEQSTNSHGLAEPARYEFREKHDPDGIGKFFMGREIARVMGHESADWLERPQRETEERPDLLIEALKIKPGESVADIGAGSGYYARRIAERVGKQGIVYAEDIQPEMLVLLTNKTAALGFQNIRPILGTITDPMLPRAAVDMVLMVDVYHEFDHPYEMIEAIRGALKPGGRIVFVEFRKEDPAVPVKPVHKMTTAQVQKEMSIHSLQCVETNETLPRQHILTFRIKI
jgi:SAM-dependent methyltransferase